MSVQGLVDPGTLVFVGCRRQPRRFQGPGPERRKSRDGNWARSEFTR